MANSVVQEYNSLLQKSRAIVGDYHVVWLSPKDTAGHLSMFLDSSQLCLLQDALLARGTLGLTVQATHCDGTRVVIKLIARGSPVSSYRGIIGRMVSCQQALSHPYVVRLVEVGRLA